MSQDNSGWFDDAVRKNAPGALLKNPGDGVIGDIVDQFQIPYVPFAKTEPAKDERTGEVIHQLVVVVQTDQRDWKGVNKIPLADSKDPSKGDKPASEDDGLRSIFVRKYTNIHAAIGEALAKANVAKGTGMADGGRLGVKITDLEPTDKGNPKKVHAALYEPPASKTVDDPWATTPGVTSSDVQEAVATPDAPADDEPPF